MRYLLTLACGLALAHSPNAPGQSGAQQPLLRTAGGALSPYPQSPWADLPPPSPLKPGVAVRVGGSIKEPRQTKHVDPKYPKSARGAAGEVSLEFVIGTNGKVRDVSVLRSSPPFEKAAIAAVKQWQYEPTRFRGAAVTVVMTVTFAFNNGKVLATPIRPGLSGANPGGLIK